MPGTLPLPSPPSALDRIALGAALLVPVFLMHGHGIADGMMAAVDMLLEHGARPDIHIAATHGLFTDAAIERLSRPEIAQVLVTNTLPQFAAAALPKIQVLDVSPVFAEAIRRSHTGESIVELLGGDPAG